jgi:hypothetical protein
VLFYVFARILPPVRQVNCPELIPIPSIFITITFAISYFNKVFRKTLKTAAFLSWTRATSEPEEFAEGEVAEPPRKLQSPEKRRQRVHKHSSKLFSPRINDSYSGWRAYNGLILNCYDHYRVFHSRDEFARGKSHVNGIEAFRSFAQRKSAKFNRLNNENFVMHLKECEFRYDNKDKDLVKILTKMVNKQKKMLAWSQMYYQ